MTSARWAPIASATCGARSNRNSVPQTGQIADPGRHQHAPQRRPRRNVYAVSRSRVASSRGRAPRAREVVHGRAVRTPTGASRPSRPRWRSCSGRSRSPSPGVWRRGASAARRSPSSPRSAGPVAVDPPAPRGPRGRLPAGPVRPRHLPRPRPAPARGRVRDRPGRGGGPAGGVAVSGVEIRWAAALLVLPGPLGMFALRSPRDPRAGRPARDRTVPGGAPPGRDRYGAATGDERRVLWAVWYLRVLAGAP